MKIYSCKTLTSAFLLISLFACKKRPDAPPPNTSTPLKPYVIGFSTLRNEVRMLSTLWKVRAKERSTDYFYKCNEQRVALGLHRRSINMNCYFGIIRDGNFSKVAYWTNATERILSAELNIDVREEEFNYQTIDPATNDLLIMVMGVSPSLIASCYYYRVTSEGVVTRHMLPDASTQTSGGYTGISGYQYFAATQKKVTAVKWLRLTGADYCTMWIGNEAPSLREVTLSVPGYDDLTVRSIYVDDENTTYALFDAKKAGGDPVMAPREWYMARIADGSKEPRIVTVSVPLEYPAIYQGIGQSKNMVVPAGEMYENKPCYLSIPLPHATSISLKAEKTMLDADPNFPRGGADRLALIHSKIYTIGAQGKFACYWEEKKLHLLDTAGLSASNATGIFMPVGL